MKMIGGLALAGTGISRIIIAKGNHHFQVSGNFLLDLQGIRAIRSFGVDPNVSLGGDIESLGPGCFSSCTSLCSLTFASQSKLTRIGEDALRECSKLRSICLPASVEVLEARSFMSCTSLSSLTFESPSNLSRIEAGALSECSSLESISLPASVEFLGRVLSPCVSHSGN
jgi:hypothetical protein